MTPVQQNNLPIFTGKPSTHTLPSGRVVSIRETNGNDEEIISNMESAQSGTNFNNFLASIILSDSTKPNETVIANDLINWPMSDIWALIFKQRLINQGKELRFPYTCVNLECEHEFTVVEDLTTFDDDLSKPSPKEEGNKYKLKKYPSGSNAHAELLTSSKKEFRYKIYNGVLAKKQLEDARVITKNTKIIMRELELKTPSGSWESVTTFHSLSSIEMREIRQHIDDTDTIFAPIGKFSCPKCKMKHEVDLMSLSSFFWPEGGM